MRFNMFLRPSVQSVHIATQLLAKEFRLEPMFFCVFLLLMTLPKKRAMMPSTAPPHHRCPFDDKVKVLMYMALLSLSFLVSFSLVLLLGVWARFVLNFNGRGP